MHASRLESGSATTTPADHTPRSRTKPRQPSLPTSQPASALRCVVATRSGRLLNPRRKAYQPPGLQLPLDEISVAGHSPQQGGGGSVPRGAKATAPMVRILTTG